MVSFLFYFRSRRWRRAEAAAVFEFLLVELLVITLDAAFPALTDVLAINLFVIINK
jgi:hypothetical protein